MCALAEKFNSQPSIQMFEKIIAIPTSPSTTETIRSNVSKGGWKLNRIENEVNNAIANNGTACEHSLLPEEPTLSQRMHFVTINIAFYSGLLLGAIFGGFVVFLVTFIAAKCCVSRKVSSNSGETQPIRRTLAVDKFWISSQYFCSFSISQKTQILILATSMNYVRMTSFGTNRIHQIHFSHYFLKDPPVDDTIDSSIEVQPIWCVGLVKVVYFWILHAHMQRSIETISDVRRMFNKHPFEVAVKVWRHWKLLMTKVQMHCIEVFRLTEFKRHRQRTAT